MDFIQLPTHKVPIATLDHHSYPTSPAAAIEEQYRYPICPLRKVPVHMVAVKNLRYITYNVLISTAKFHLGYVREQQEQLTVKARLHQG